jgi:hypothetical protein
MLALAPLCFKTARSNSACNHGTLRRIQAQLVFSAGLVVFHFNMLA